MQTEKQREVRQESSNGLPVVIRHNTQDFDLHQLEDPRVNYISEYNDRRSGDGFVASIPHASRRLRKISIVYLGIATTLIGLAIWRVGGALLEILF
jgi:hypothetical protein